MTSASTGLVNSSSRRCLGSEPELTPTRSGVPWRLATSIDLGGLLGAADVAGVDAHAVRAGVDRLDRQRVVEVDVGDHGDRRLAHDRLERLDVLVARDGDADDVGAGLGDAADLVHRRGRGSPSRSWSSSARRRARRRRWGRRRRGSAARRPWRECTRRAGARRPTHRTARIARSAACWSAERGLRSVNGAERAPSDAGDAGPRPPSPPAGSVLASTALTCAFAPRRRPPRRPAARPHAAVEGLSAQAGRRRRPKPPGALTAPRCPARGRRTRALTRDAACHPATPAAPLAVAIAFYLALSVLAAPRARRGDGAGAAPPGPQPLTCEISWSPAGTTTRSAPPLDGDEPRVVAGRGASNAGRRTPPTRTRPRTPLTPNSCASSSPMAGSPTTTAATGGPRACAMLPSDGIAQRARRG